MRFNRVFHRGRLVLFAAAIAMASVLMPFAAHRPASAAEPDTIVNWIDVGPSGPNIGSGKINAFAFVESNPNVMYMAGGWGNTPRESPSQSGIYGTTDRGAHWVALDNGLTNPDGTISSTVNGLWLDQANPSVLLAATEFGGTFRSTDGGASWHNVDPSESTQFAQSGSTLYVASRRGVLASVDGGETWTVSLASALGASTVVTANGVTYAGTMSGDVYRRIGTSWFKKGHPGTGPIHNLAVDPFNTKIVYANVDDQSAWNENLYGSIDSGKTWAFINCPCSIGAQALAASRVVPHRMYLGDDGGGVIYYFTADGNPNPVFNSGAQPFGVDMRYIVVAPGVNKTDDACYLLEDQGLFFAQHCTSGVAPGLADNVADTLTYDVKISSNANNAIVPLQDNSAASSTDGGKNWNYPGAANAGEGGEAFIDPKNPQHCYFAHPDSGLWTSFDACASFSGPVTGGIESLTFDPAHAGKIYAVEGADADAGQIFVSTNSGGSWNASTFSFTQPYQIAQSPADANTFMVATGTATGVNHVYYSHDGGKTFHETSGLPHLLPHIFQGTTWFGTHRFYMTFEPGVAGTILLADHDPATDNLLIYRSVDNGLTFTHVKTIFQPAPARPWPHLQFPTSHERANSKIPYYATRFFGNRLAFNPQPPTGKTPSVVLTTRFGAFISRDVGVTWNRIDKLAISHHFEGLAWNNGFVYLATYGEGVVRSSKRLQ